MRVLIAVPSCARDRHSRQPAHNELLWRCLLEQKARCALELEYRYFLGVGNSDPGSREAVVPTRDDWNALPEKVRAAFAWALDFEFDWVLKMDTDTWVHPGRLAAALPELATRQYTGLVGSMVTQGIMGDPPGGACYGVSKQAIIHYLQGYCENGAKTAGWQRNEDFCLGKYMHQMNIQPVHEPRFWDLRLGAVPDPTSVITVNEWDKWNGGKA